MSEQTAVVESSSTPVIEIDRGPLVTLTPDQRAEFRRTGELPVQPKKNEDSASSDAAKEPTSEAEDAPEAKTAGETEPPKSSQEHTRRKPGAEQRIAQLTSEKKRLEAELQAFRSKPAADAQPAAKPVQQPQPQQYTRPRPTPEGKNSEGKPYETYEDFVEDLSDWKSEQRESVRQREQQQQEQARSLNAKVEDARSRYDNFDEVLGPTINAIMSDGEIPLVVKTIMNESDVLPDLIAVIGSDPKERAHFIEMTKSNPGKAIRYIALTESLIAEELAGAKSSAKPVEGEEPPAKPQTKAPRPPAEAGGRAASPPDTMQAALEGGGGKLTSNIKAEFARRALAKLKS